MDSTEQCNHVSGFMLTSHFGHSHGIATLGSLYVKLWIITTLLFSWGTRLKLLSRPSGTLLNTASLNHQN